MFLRKATGRCGIAGHWWDADNDVVEVPDQLGYDLLAIPGNDFSIVEETKVVGKPVDSYPVDTPAARILEWVGIDKERAAAALEAERQREEPRTSLIAKLEKIAG